MYYRTTRAGISVSTIEMRPRDDNGVDIGEFSFSILTPQGVPYVFRYQMDEIGIPLWHLYENGEGCLWYATEKRHRDSLGTIPVNFSDSDIDSLIGRIDKSPEITIHLLVPGHQDANPRPDIVLFPLDADVMATLQSFSSISDCIVGGGKIAQRMGKLLDGAISITLSGENRKFFNEKGRTELGQIALNLDNDGFHVYISEKNRPLANIPPCIRKEIEKAVFIPFYFERKKGMESGGIVNASGMPVGEIRDFDAIIAKYRELSKQKLRISMLEKQTEKKERKERTSFGQRSRF